MAESEMIKMFAVAVIVLAICSAGAFATYNVGKYFDNKHQQSGIGINSFEDCVNAGNSAITGNPLRCISSNGTVYLGNETIS